MKTKWHHHAPAGSQHTAGGFVTDSPDRLSVDAQMICHVHRSQEWGRLIAAAPDMLEALEASPHRLHDSIDGEDDCRCSQCKFVRLRDAALSTYRKQGGNT